MSESKGPKRYNGVEQDDEGAYVYYDEHIAALRRAKAEGMREASDMVEDDCYALSESDVSDPTHAAKVLHNVNQQALSNKIDAHAAKIEEGE